MNKLNIEILAPAGSFESLNAAINAGADSVFLGIADFNMRASAAVNFTRENLQEVVKLCHENKVKVYLTVNTLLYNDDLGTMRDVVDLAKKTRVDALIVADIATVVYAREKGMEVHISTQLSISNTEGVKFYSQFADRIVLARELKLEQIKKIHEDIIAQEIKGPKGELVEIEAFAHGAMCVAVSGRCSMSLYCSGTSANKGKCSQICRRPFTVTDDLTGKKLRVDNNFVMSASDLCTIGMLPQMIDAGVKVFKFEGRGRAPEYVDMVIRSYKEAFDSIENGTYTKDKIKAWNKDLGTVFNRGQSTGLYMGLEFSEWAMGSNSKATRKKVQIGRH